MFTSQGRVCDEYGSGTEEKVGGLFVCAWLLVACRGSGGMGGAIKSSSNQQMSSLSGWWVECFSLFSLVVAFDTFLTEILRLGRDIEQQVLIAQLQNSSP